MVDPDLRSSVSDALALTPASFRERAREEAEAVLAAVDDGTFDNPQGLVGLEHEFYAVAPPETATRWVDGARAGTLGRVPRRLLEYVGFEKELGLHNAELSTSPQPLNADGLRAQHREVAARLRTVRDPLQCEGLRLISDGVWTVPPPGETATAYLTDHVTVDDWVFATNASGSARYHALSNGEPRPGMEIDLPGVSLSAETVLLLSLTASIQPHYQVPHARDLPTYLRYAHRVAAPLLAIGANAPFLPPDLYDEGAGPETVLEDGHAESRIAVFEGVMNAPDGPEKVRFPRDPTSVEGVLDDLVTDPPLVPTPFDRGGSRFDDDFPHLRHKHGTYWRWVRPVFDGASRETANARVEFRPLPGQPTIVDAVAFQAAFGGLMVGLYATGHPVLELDWTTARENFYAAAEDGLDAALTWITADGDRTSDLDRLYDDLFGVAADGLRMQDVPEDDVERYLRPLRARVDARTAPADWKRDRARSYLDAGDSVGEAIHATQRDYFERQAETRFDGTFADWLGGTG